MHRRHTNIFTEHHARAHPQQLQSVSPEASAAGSNPPSCSRIPSTPLGRVCSISHTLVCCTPPRGLAERRGWWPRTTASCGRRTADCGAWAAWRTTSPIASGGVARGRQPAAERHVACYTHAPCLRACMQIDRERCPTFDRKVNLCPPVVLLSSLARCAHAQARHVYMYVLIEREAEK